MISGSKLSDKVTSKNFSFPSYIWTVGVGEWKGKEETIENEIDETLRLIFMNYSLCHNEINVVEAVLLLVMIHHKFPRQLW